MPPEIRCKIWEELYPTQIVHTPYMWILDRVEYCKAAGTEEEAYEAWRGIQLVDGPANQQRWRSDIYCSSGARHGPDVRLLRICKTFQREIEEPIYRTHIFAFSNVYFFSYFIEERTESPKSHIRALMLSCYNMSGQQGLDWEQSIQLEDLRQLTALRKLHIYTNSLLADEGFLCVVERFQICPLKVATVILNRHRPSQDAFDMCEGLMEISLQPWDEASGSERIAGLEARIQREIEAYNDRAAKAAAEQAVWRGQASSRPRWLRPRSPWSISL